MRGDIGLVKQLDTRIERRKQELTGLETARKILVASEPEVTTPEVGGGGGNATTVGVKRRGRPRSANAKRTAPKSGRGPGRPKGSKNKPKAPSAPDGGSSGPASAMAADTWAD